MGQEDFYYSIEKKSMAEFKDRGSRFIAYAYPLKGADDFKERWAASKKEHPKATHHCFAYRIGLDGTQARVGDDGEPAGTAGRPILGQIDSRKLTDTLVIVVRYFGGTLLGVPGLIHAYKSATAMVLQLTPVVQNAIEISYGLAFDYTRVNEIMTILKRTNCSILQKDLQLFCKMEIGIPKKREAEILYMLQDLSNVEIVKR
jgi:uncharacterized YigZ family protein